jgi:hypothetical protein
VQQSGQRTERQVRPTGFPTQGVEYQYTEGLTNRTIDRDFFRVADPVLPAEATAPWIELATGFLAKP